MKQTARPKSGKKARRRTRKNRLAQIKSEWRRELWDRYVLNENDERAALLGCKVDEDRGWWVVKFFEKWLVHTKGRWAGKPFKLADCQIYDIVLPLFSWMREGGERRRFTDADIWVPKKNFKSTMLSGFGLYGLIADEEPGPEVYAAANDREQANIVFGTAADMVEVSPKLKTRLEIVRSKKTIRLGINGVFRALSSDASSNEGFNPSMTIVDELHVFDARGRVLFEALKYGGVLREQSLFIVISTAGADDTGIGFEQYEYSKGVLSGAEENPYHFAYIREADKDDDPGDPKTHRKANPMIGVTIKSSELAEAWQAAKGNPRRQASFCRYRLNMWVGTSDPWLDLGAWVECEEAFDLDELKDEPCTMGVDLAENRDLTAVALCFRREGLVWFWCHFWLPGADIAQKERTDRTPYRALQDQGFCTITDTETTDNALIEERIIELAEAFDLRSISFDRWAAKDLMQRLQDEHGMKVVPIPQTCASMNTPSRAFDSLIAERKLRHAANPILKKQASVVTATSDTKGNIMPSKTKDGRRSGKRTRIDGIVACVLALEGMLTLPKKKRSIYEDGGLLVLGE